MAKNISSVIDTPKIENRAIDLIRNRKQAYLQTFKQNLATETVISDLAQFCRGSKSTFDPDPRIHALLEGRREVWLRIADHLNMTEDELFNKYVRGK